MEKIEKTGGLIHQSAVKNTNILMMSNRLVLSLSLMPFQRCL
ncbi:hypothetical protein [Rodentibacter heidelbergensis]|nr:hypothetical protein [Rodentibacter heidelbergensis]